MIFLVKVNKKSTYDPYADEVDFNPWNKDTQNEGKTMAELMKAKLAKMDNGEKKKEEEGKESIEARKARMIAQRELIVKQKQEKMNKELEEAREGKTDNKYSNNLFKELMSLDKKVNQKEAMKKGVKQKEGSTVVKPNEDDEAQPISSKKPK